MAIKAVVIFKLKEQDREKVIANLFQFIEKAKANPGCVSIEFLEGLDDPHQFAFIETWRDESSFLEHTQSANFQMMAPYIGTHFIDLKVHRMTDVVLDQY